MSNQISPFAQASFKTTPYIINLSPKLMKVTNNPGFQLAPCLPRHLSEMQNYHNFGEIKMTASLFINHFKKHGQKLVEIPNFRNK